MAVPMVDELDLAARYLPGQLVAVTGTNGKSTTTALIALMLKAAGKRVFCGGNLAPGLPLSAALSRPRQDFYVVEASSFQLERARWLKPRVAVVLNITPDHLNRHQTLRRYAWCKLRVLRLQDEHDFAVLNRDDRLVRSAPTRARRCWFSLSERVDGAWLEENSLWFLGRRVMPASKVRLAGRHNVANALAALSAVRLLGLGNRAVVRTLGTFAGLPHRLEHVRSLAGVDYVNNSMCTNPAAGVHSLVAAGDGRRGGVVLIAGGKGKGLRISEYARAIVRHARWTVLIGDTRWQLARELAARRYERFELASDLGQAVRQARQRAVKGDVVLLSPGFASFDQFADFAARGAAFRHAVNRLR
jgi:UDP-N-acetylmuramoylalanine--D-glutamate ligase